MTREQELWGMAATLLAQHGDLAPVRVAQRIGELALSGETGGVALWKDVAHRMAALMQQQHRA